jgi:para-aminobenzoate synthetase/4-amino-4-deoxychorismate lyase
MRSDDGTIPLLELHVTRLMRSAAFFGFPVDPVRIRERIREVAGLATGSVKVRLTLGHGGDEEIVVSPAQTSAEWRTATISDERILSSDPYRRHKTTRREMYEVEHRKALAAGYDEVLFLNEKGQLAEGSRSNIVVVRGNSWWTPPVESGALPGVYRQHLLRTRTDLRERVLYIDDLLEASDIYLCNALMGLVRAHVVIEAVDVHPQV